MPTRQRGITRNVNLKGLTPYLALLLVPAPAGAAPFGELPFRTVPTAAVCVQATGAPGELSRWTPGGITVMQARADGLRDAAFVGLGQQRLCPAVAADATTGAASRWVPGNAPSAWRSARLGAA